MRHFVNYVLAKYATSGINFLIPLFLPVFLKKEDMGLIATFYSIYTLLFFFISLNANAYLLRAYVDEKENLSSLFQLSSLIMLSMCTVILIVFILLESFLRQISHFALIDLILVPLAVLFWQFITLFLTYFQAQQKSMQYSLLLLGRTSLATALMFIMIIILDLGWDSRIYSFLYTDVLLSMALLFVFRRYFSSFIIDKEFIGKTIATLKYGVPLIPHNLAMWVLFAADIFFINYYIGSEGSAIYYIANMMGLIIGLFQDAITTAWNPHVFAKIKNNDINQSYLIRYGALYFFILMILGAVVAFSAPVFLSYMYDGSYDEAVVLIPFMISAYVFNGIYKFFAAIIFYSKRTMLLWYASVTAAMLNIILNFMVIEEYGVLGVAISTCISFFVSMVITIWLGLREFKLISNIVSEKYNE